ncbi:MAG: protein kinase [Myxococcales bacterium]|nr:protein kinase [Myxococcales bacterium]
MSAESIAIEPGALIGSYEVLRPLGKGGMGIVFEARSRVSQQTVALKTVRTANPYLLSSIRREIQRLRRLSHPGVVRILDDGTFGGLPFYAMELLKGRTLEHEIELRSDSGPRSDRGSGPDSAAMNGNLATIDGQDAQLHEHVPILVRGERGPLSAEAIADFLEAIRRLCDALVYIHGEGVVHRELIQLASCSP